MFQKGPATEARAWRVPPGLTAGILSSCELTWEGKAARAEQRDLLRFSLLFVYF